MENIYYAHGLKELTFLNDRITQGDLKIQWNS